MFKYILSFCLVFVDANLERENHIRGERENLVTPNKLNCGTLGTVSRYELASYYG